jgi:L-alanine-DL-glutamate epimerase-like enolase superfamily enzyme
MKITKIECSPLKYPTRHYCQGKTPVQDKHRMGYGEAPTLLPIVIVQIHTDEGITGIGESGGITSLTYMPDTVASIIETITEYFAPFILGENPLNIDKIVNAMEKKSRGNYQAKAAIDLALHDIAGKALNIPVYQYLGGLTAEKVPMHWVISTGIGEEVVAEALGAVKAGWRALKLKVGLSNPDADLETVAAVRKAVGSGIILSADANAAWNYHQALRFVTGVEKHDMQFVEQPTQYWDFEGMATLRRHAHIPIVADESASGLADLMRLIKLEAADAFLLKVPKAGGLLRSKMWASIARAAGKPIIVGEKIGLGIQFAACVHFACSTDWLTSGAFECGHGPGAGLASSHGCYELGPFIKDDVVVNLPVLKEGYMYPPTGPGLGVELNHEIIEKYRTGPNVVKTIR